MNTVLMNIVSLDGGTIIKKGSGGSSGGGGVTIKNQVKVIDIVENGSTEVLPDAGFTGLEKVSVNVNVPIGGGGTSSKPKWTGHADAEGLRAIGWTDEDIAYYQAHGVNWNEEDDEYHKVSDDNKALYGVLTADNIANYRDRIVYLPKIDTSNVVNMGGMFYGCYSLVSIPQLDTSKTTSLHNIFGECYSLVSIPQLDTSKVTTMANMFANCYSLMSIPQLDTQNVANMTNTFYDCYSLVSIPQLDTSNVIYITNMFRGCYSLTTANLKNAKRAYDLSSAKLLSKDSLLYIINNEAATSAITIKLASYAYTRLAEDADVVAALANHPNVSLAQ